VGKNKPFPGLLYGISEENSLYNAKIRVSCKKGALKKQEKEMFISIG